MATITQLASRQRNQIGAVDEANLQAIARAYGIMDSRLRGDVDALMFAIQDLDNPTGAEIKRLPQYKRLMRNMESELDRFESYLEVAIGAAALAAIAMGLQHSSDLVKSYGVKFASLDASVMPQLLRYLRQDGPLYARLKLITTGTLDKVIDQIVTGVGSGFNPQKIARLIQDAFGGGLTDALRNMRTVQLWSYRDSARANYTAAGVEKWVWWAELDDVCCMSCVSQHGSIHDMSETLDDHYNGRCAMLPYIEGLSPTERTGQEWFDGLSEQEQSRLMGPGKLEAYKAGKFTFDKLSKQVDNEVYGTMRTEAPLIDLLGE